MISNIIVTVAALSGISGVLSILLVLAEKFLADYGECKITINDEEQLVVKGGATLLSALGSQKIFLPSACGGRGTCSYCKCKVLEGVGPILPTEEPLLSKDEIKDNVRLACQIKVKQDIKIEIPDELFNIKEFKSEVELIKDLTYDIKLLKLKLIEPSQINFKAGQYVQLISEPYNGVKDVVSRAYSIASPDSQKDSIELMIRLVPDGIETTWVHQYLNQNDKVKFIGPMGDFQLHEGKGEMILIAGGSGMAPMVSLLNYIAAKQIDRPVKYFFGANAKRDIFYVEEMKFLEQKISQFNFIPALSSPLPDDEWNGETGLITEPLEKYLKTQTDTSETQGYLCGSPGMLDACIKILKQYGISDDRIFFDPFE